MIQTIEKSDFIITSLKNRISLLKQQLMENKCNNQFFFKQKISPIGTYSDNNDDNTSINDSSKSINKNRHSSKNYPLADERKSFTTSGDSLLNGINEKGLSHKHRVRSLINLEQPVKEYWMKLMT